MTIDESSITVSWEHYCQLVADSEELSFLKEAGVDNWEGYEEAQEMMEAYYNAEDESVESWLAENGDREF